MFMKLILGLAVATSFTSALASTAQAATRAANLPIKALVDLGDEDRDFSMFGCSDFVQCVSNMNELNDGDIGVGLFSKYQFQGLVFENFTMAEVSPVNWSSATAVTSVTLQVGLQASGNACTQVGAGVFHPDFPHQSFATSKEFCQTASHGAQSLSFPIDPPGGGTWTVAKLRGAEFETYLNRLQSGARHYVAALKIRVIYQAP